MNATAVTGSVQAGQNAVYKISVWPQNAAVNDVTVQISVATQDSSPAFPAPVFAVCGNGDGTRTCSLGPLKTGQAPELQAEVAVPSSAPSGDSATLTATATGAASGATTTGSVSSLATVSVTVASPTPTPTPTPTSSHSSGSGHSGGSGSGSGSGSRSGSGGGSSSGSGSNLGSQLGITTPALGSLPLPPGSGSLSPGTTAGNPVGLFPTINPSSSPAAPTNGAPGSAGHGRAPYHARTVADVLPLGGGLVGSQIAGLVVLALGIIVAVARVSLRRPRASDGKE